jgi:cell division septum initiation protein DivIVA
MSSNEWLPAQIPFDLVRRGFAPDQVTAHLERLEYDLRIATANGDATNQRLSEVSAQLHNAQAEADELRTQLDNLAREPVSMTGLSNRMQRMIRLAEEEAAEIRARANAEADKVTGTAAAAAAATAAEREAFDGERERTRRQLADQVRDMLAEANSDAEATRRSAQEESQAALAAATAAAERLLTDATEESRSTLTAARQESTATLTAAREEATATLTSARAEAEHTLSSAREEAESLTAASTAERQRLDAEGNARRKAIDEDFEIAISSRRAEAHQRLAEREEISVADANNRITEATAEAERRVQEATDHAAELIRRAAAESHQRVADADQAVQALTALRSQVLDQLASLRDHLAKVDALAASAPALLDPPDTESNRPVTAEFPVDPGQRPTGLPANYNSEPGPWDQVTVESVRAERAREQGGSNGRTTTVRTDDDDDLEALTADLSFDKSDVPSLSAQGQAQAPQTQSEPAVSIPSGSAPAISAAMAESDTDTFARITDIDDGGQASAPPTTGSPNNTPMPAQHRTGLRAFADRAMGGR